jgi:hypothetical protein
LVQNIGLSPAQSIDQPTTQSINQSITATPYAENLRESYCKAQQVENESRNAKYR